MNTITIKDPNGNIVCSVENVNASKSEEGFDWDYLMDSIFVATPLVLIAIYFIAGIVKSVKKSNLKNKMFIKKVLSKLDKNYINYLQQELNTIIKDEDKFVNNVIDIIKKKANSYPSVRDNCDEVYVYHDDSMKKKNEKEYKKFILNRIHDIITSSKDSEHVQMQPNVDTFYLQFLCKNNIVLEHDAYDDFVDLEKFASNMNNFKNCSSKYIKGTEVYIGNKFESDGMIYFIPSVNFIFNYEEINKLTEPLKQAIEDIQ